MRITIVDVETTFKVINGKTTPSPYLAENRLISLGYDSFEDESDYLDVAYNFYFHPQNVMRQTELQGVKYTQRVLNETQLLVGHNLKFDLAWLHETGFHYRGKLWDTMIADYVLARGMKLPLSLHECCVRHGITGKRKDITEEYLDKGISFENIPIDQLEEYGRQDVQADKELFLKQWELLHKPENIGLLPTIEMMNEFLYVLLNMEKNGIRIDLDILDRIKRQYQEENDTLQHELRDLIHEFMGDTPVNINSPEQLSELIYSRKVKDKHRWKELFNIGSELRGSVRKPKRKTKYNQKEFVELVRAETERIYKTKASVCDACLGEKKTYRKTKKDIQFKKATKCRTCQGQGFLYERRDNIAGLCCIPISYEDAAEGGFATDKETLLLLSKQTKSPKAKRVLEILIRLNAIDTYINTYCEGIRKNTNDFNILRTTINQCIAATGRTTSSNPNFQNMPRGNTFPVKECVISRFEGGEILSVDFAGLEFRTAVELAHDERGISDILDGVDVHTFTAETLTKAGQPTNRQDAKSRTFSPLFGASKGTNAEMEYYLMFLKKYSGISEWQVELQDQAIKHKIIRIPSGREYAFPGAKRNYWGGSTFATQIKNYPVQGFATADIVPCACIDVYNEFISKKLKSVLFLTVHDDIVCDVYPGERDIVVDIFIRRLENVKETLKVRYNYDMTVPLGIEIKCGPNWLHMKEIYKTPKYR